MATSPNVRGVLQETGYHERDVYWVGKPRYSLLTALLTISIFVVTAFFTFFPFSRFSYFFNVKFPQKVYHNLDRFIPWFSFYSLRSNPSDLSVAINSFSAYQEAQQQTLNGKWASYYRLKVGDQKTWGRKLGWGNRLKKVEEAIKCNKRLTDELGVLGMMEAKRSGARKIVTSKREDGRVVEVLKHFVRDWSEEGAAERELLFPPILLALQDEFKGTGIEKARVLVPGAGLCRLAWEIAKSGFPTDANDFSHFMNLSRTFLFTCTVKPFQHVIHPYIHSFSHQRSTQNMMRHVSFPDVVPGCTFKFGDHEPQQRLNFLNGDFLTCVKEEGAYDAVVTLFFIDTASNICDYLQKIYAVLKPGGVWINEGPLLYWGRPTMELSLEEIIRLSELVGFVIEKRTSMKGAGYTGDSQGMYSFTYDPEFWIARKPSTKNVSSLLM